MHDFNLSQNVLYLEYSIKKNKRKIYIVFESPHRDVVKKKKRKEKKKNHHIDVHEKVQLPTIIGLKLD